jgi:hypothetical protein
MFEAKLPARKFKGYKCTRAETVRATAIHMAEDKHREVPVHLEML